MAVLDKYGCNAAACHGAPGGKGGLALSMFGAYPADDYAAITKSSEGRRVNPVEPSKSLLLQKATGAMTHKGGALVLPGSRDAEALAAWLGQGAAWRGTKAAQLTGIEVGTRELTLKKGESGEVAVTAVFSDGGRGDVSDEARYRSTDDGVAAVKEGRIEACNFGQATIVVSYLRRTALISIMVPQPLEPAFPKTPENNEIDKLVFARLKVLGVPPSQLASDEEFVRRVYLDVIGLLPKPDEARSFLGDPDPRKRAKLIDRLLERPEFADYWALKWGDLLRIKSEYPSNLWPNGVQAYHHWIREAIANNKPYDQFVRELLVSTGSNFRDPPCNYYRAIRRRDPQGFAEATALVFLGARLECARCHAHPIETWTRDDDLGMAAFFPQVRFKNTQEWKEEIVFLDPDAVFRHSNTLQPIAPKVLGSPATQVEKGEDPRARFAAKLTAPDNPWFARNIVNRVWFWLLGRGIVHEVDDLRPTNPPSNPELLTYLERELVSHKYDLKHIFRLVLNSRVYQLSSRSNEWNVQDVALFSHYPIKRLGAEQLLDAIGQVTETSEDFTSAIPEPYTVLPKGWRATQLFDGSIGTPFLELFGRPSRDTAYESERCTQASMHQSLYMLSSAQLEAKIGKSPRIERLTKSDKGNAELVEEIYLAALSRLPNDEEKQRVLEYVGDDPKLRKQALQDLMWALLNTKEFMFDH
ncbi:MAG TPA: DUF1549 and DUF1553 domain-containing protein [Phycisphaerae bacterium]|nr:DUF1549 and DUF1553 domain-containing protein [Phycisphaerae bacterium]